MGWLLWADEHAARDSATVFLAKRRAVIAMRLTSSSAAPVLTLITIDQTLGMTARKRARERGNR